MQADVPSGTALNVAMQRAAHQVFDEGRILNDPLALRILGAEAAEAVSRMDNGSANRRWRTFMCARSQFAENRVRAAVEEHGVRQLVVLGAGLDTFAYRNPYEGTLKVFEVDHPATQRWKLDCLTNSGISIPDSVDHVPAIIGEDDLLPALWSSGFDESVPSFFTCLGLFYYLDRETISAILSMIAGVGGQVAFDYSDPPETLSDFERDEVDRWQGELVTAGEPMVGYYAAGELHATLRSMGFEAIEDLSPAAWMGRFGGDEMLAEWREITADPERGAHMLFART